MNQIERLTKEHPQLSVNIISLLRKFDPSNTGKYTQFLINNYLAEITKQINKLDNDSVEMLKHFNQDLNTNEKYVLWFLTHVIGRENLAALWEFHTHLEEKRIENNDISKYRTFNEIKVATNSAELKKKEKELQKQIKTIYDDGEWLLIKPLSFQASLAYGSGTRWCTASKNNKHYFYDYASRGVIIYGINRKTSYKFAVFIELTESRNHDVSFWTSDDVRVESLQMDIPDHILSEIKKQIKDRTELKPNKYFFGIEELAYYKHEKLTKLSAVQEDDDIELPRPPVDAVDVTVMCEGEPILEDVVPDIEQLVTEEYFEEDIIPKSVNSCFQIHPDGGLSLKMSEQETQDLIMFEKANDNTFVSETTQSANNAVFSDNIVPLNPPTEFIPAPWLTEIEINNVKSFLKVPILSGKIYAYPNGRTVVVEHVIKNGVITNEVVTEVLGGRDKDTKYNPFNPKNVDFEFFELQEDREIERVEIETCDTECVEECDICDE